MFLGFPVLSLLQSFEGMKLSMCSPALHTERGRIPGGQAMGAGHLGLSPVVSCTALPAAREGDLSWPWPRLRRKEPRVSQKNLS